MAMDLNTLTFLVFVSLLAIVGIVGNALIVAVYVSNFRKFFHSKYILALSIADLVVNVLIVPYSAVFQLRLVTLDFICHGMEVIRHTSVGFSNLILALIAMERLLMIWKPLESKAMSEKYKLIPIFVVLAISIVCSIPAGAIYQVTDKAYDFNGSSNSSESATEPFCQYTTEILGKGMSEVYRNVLAFVILLEFLVMIVVYVLVYVLVCRQKLRLRRYSLNSVTKTNKRMVTKNSETSLTSSSAQNYESTDDQEILSDRRIPQGNGIIALNSTGTQNQRHEARIESSDTAIVSPVKVSLTSFTPRGKIKNERKSVSFDTDTTAIESGVEVEGFESETMSSSTSGQAVRKRKRFRKKSSRNARPSRAIRKTWTMFFICTAVYLLSWVPFFFEIFNVTRILVFRYFFLVGHAANPIIYSVVNIKIRNAIKKLFRCRRTHM